MKRSELVDHIKGSYLKKQYLEAFLVQSAYIEGILKVFSDYQFWNDVKQGGERSSKMIDELRKKVRKFNLNDTINFLSDSGFLDKPQNKDLHRYREKRNRVLHDLVKQITTIEFDKEIKETCDLGDKIINDSKFKHIEVILDHVENGIEKRRSEIIKNSPVLPKLDENKSK